MTTPITGIDHVLVGVRDLDAAREGWSRLGFTATPRGRHVGWGTANYCLMFADDYIELLGIVDPTLETNNLDRFIETREGLMAAAFAGKAEAAYAAFREAGIAVEEPRDLARDLELPEGTVQPRFKLTHLPEDATPGLAAFVCQHLTPKLMRRPEWLDHANGARAIAGIGIVVEDPAAGAAAWLRLAGEGAVTAAENRLEVRFGPTVLRFTGPEAERHPVHGDLAPPFVASLRIEVGDLAATDRCLAKNDIPTGRAEDGALVVSPGDATGVELVFAPPA